MMHPFASGAARGFVVATMMLSIAATVRAQDKQPLERVTVIESKGKTGGLDHLDGDWKNSRLFLANTTNNTLDVLDVKNNKLLKQVAEQKQIRSIAYAADLDRIFVGNGEGVCNAIDGKDYIVVKSAPVQGADSVRYDARSQRVYVAGKNQLAVLDAKTMERVATVKLSGSSHGFQIASKKPRVFMNTGSPCQVAVIDTDKNELVTHYSLEKEKGIGPLTLDEANGRVLVGVRGMPRLAVLDLETGKDVASVPIPEGCDDMFLDSKSKRIYISCSSGFVAVIRQIDLARYESVANVATIKGAKTSTYDPTAKRLYVAVPHQSGKEGPEIWVYQAR
jgi:DNA-binding beta-propeller fold protein YncE